uniref:E3 ubiquitin-protein ligase MSL2 n=1 Tax=Graphocephala atropunctata TaxID=36148 RepID=A0A1B6KIA3_9HEMI
MNATSLYVSTCRLILQANAEDSASWTDLFRLVPYLRQSLSCTVCGNLLIEPYTPTETNCQHHVCKSCKGGRKKLKPSCSWCKDYEKYVENVQLRILLQCYKKLCEYLTSTSMFKKIAITNSPPNNTNTNLLDGTTPTLVNLIQEGAGFADEFRSSASARSSSYILPCVYTNSTSTQTNSASTSVVLPEEPPTEFPSNGESENSECPRPLQNGPSMYSVLHAGSGNKLTIKRKASESISEVHETPTQVQNSVPPPSPKPLMSQSPQQSSGGALPAKKLTRGKASLGVGITKIGCRCGNATATPGKLTCCGQRCACYTENKACVDCKCRGCRNPHTADGQKMCPMTPGYQSQLTADDTCQLSGPKCVTLGSNDMATASGGTVQVTSIT